MAPMAAMVGAAQRAYRIQRLLLVVQCGNRGQSGLFFNPSAQLRTLNLGADSLA